MARVIARLPRRRWRSIAVIAPLAALTVATLALSQSGPIDSTGTRSEELDAAATATASGVAFVPGVARDVPGVAAPEAGWPITIAAVGDIMPGRSVAASLLDGDPAGPFRYVTGVLSGTDIVAGNLESSIATAGSPAAKTYTFRAPPAAADALAYAGFDVVSLANNHALDYGPDALAETLGLLEAAGVRTAGAGLDDTLAGRPVFMTIRGLRITFLAFNDAGVEVGQTAWEASPGHPGVTWWDNVASPAAISAARADADLVIVFVHFGYEYAPGPSARQQAIAHAAVDAGARLVLGAHPHVLQTVEAYDDGLIAYSLGNFVFDGFSGAANETAVLNVTIDKDGIAGWSMTPASIGWDGLPRPAQ